MNSKEYRLQEAERLYVYDFNTIEEIASKINISPKTVSRWKVKNDWEHKRQLFFKSKQSFHQELFELARKLMKNISADMDSGEEVDPRRMYALCRILPMFSKVKDYEDIVSIKVKNENQKSLTPDLVSLIEEQILGISPSLEEFDEGNK